MTLMMHNPHWITIIMTMSSKLIKSMLNQTDSICYRLHKSKRMGYGCPKLCLNLSAPIQSLSLSVFVYVCLCVFIAYGVYLYVCLVESRCLSRKHTPSPTNAPHNPLNDMQQSLHTNPISVTAGREATTSVM